MKKIYVTCQVKPAKVLGLPTKHYAIECETLSQVQQAIADIYSYDGVTYIDVNKCGRLKKGTIVLPYNSEGNYSI